MPTVTGRATDFITFSRTSNATVTGADGKIKWAGHNLLTNSESFDASAWGKYLTTVTANSTAAPNGTTTADTIATTSSNATIYQTSSIPVGTSTFSCWFKAGTLTSVKVIFDGGAATGREATFTLSGSGTAGAVANSSGGAGTFSGGTSSITPLADGWYLCTIANVTTTAAGGLTLLLATSGNIIAWGAHLYRSDLGGMVLNPARGDAYYPTTPRNLLGFTEDFSNALWGKANLLAFGSGSIANAIIAPNGLQTADKIVESTANGLHTIDQYYTTTASPYTFSVYLKRAERSFVLVYHGQSNTGIVVNLDTGATTLSAGISAPVASSVTPVGDGWYRCSITVNATAASNFFRVYLMPNASVISYTGDGTSGIYLWGAQLSDSASLDAYSPVYGAAVTSAAYYAPRLDYSGSSLAALGLLVEEQRTNLLLQSNDLANASWTLANAGSRTASTDVAPDGTTSAATITDNISGNFTSVRQTLTVTNNSAAYAASVYIKKTTSASSYPGVSLALTGGTAKYASAALNTTTGVATARTGETPDFLVVSDAGSYWRLSLGITNNTTGNTSLQLDIYAAVNADASATWVAATTGSVVAWGAQLEAGSFATSYIPTGASTATRTADVASVSTQAFPYSSTAGSIVVSYDRVGIRQYSRLFNLGDASENNQVSVLNYNTSQENPYIVSSGSSTIVPGPALPAANTVAKMGFAFRSGDSAYSLNGAAAVANATTFTMAATSLAIGATQVSGQYINGHIRQITYIPRRLSNSELQARTV